MDDPNFTGLEKTNLLFKKYYGKPDTNQNRRYYEEPNRPSRVQVIADTQLWSSPIASVAPPELSSLTDSDFDDSGVYKMAGSLVGRTSNNGIIKRFIKVPLTMLLGSVGNAYEAPISSVSHPGNNAMGTFGSGYGAVGTFNRVIQDTIPMNQDPLGSYLFHLYRNDGTEISYGFGSWDVDNTGGIVTFYDYSSISSEVSEASPPLISCYKYIGQKGIPNNISTGVTIFSGIGSGGNTADNLAAIQVGTVNTSSLGCGVYSDSLQFGGTFDGAIRLTVEGGNNSHNTAFVIQRRTNGIWKNLQRFY